MGNKERPDELASVPDGGELGMKWRKPFSPKTRKIRPRRKRAMTVVVFMLRLV